MPDEALQASLQGRPRQAPDFSPLALAHLHTSALAVRQLIKQYLSAPSKVQLGSLITAVRDIHQTLQLLDRQGAILVTTELSLLLEAMSANKVDDRDACAHTLVFAGERLADYVAHLQRPGAVDSALPLLPVINNCRACRGEELLSEMLVVASGIDLPSASSLPEPSVEEINAFTECIAASRASLMNSLVGWFTDDEKRQVSLKELSAVFANLSKSCDAPTSLQPLVPLFDSAEFICDSVRQGALDNSAAIQTLFAQIERLLDAYSKLDKNDAAQYSQPVPERLFLNMLYYVALSSETSSKAVALRRRFRLDRFIPRGIASDRSQVVFEGVGDRLADSIRDAIELETESARAWLIDTRHPVDDLDRVRNRLTQLEPAIMLLGAQESMRQMVLINQAFAKLELVDGKKSALDVANTERIADALVRLERALDTEINAVRARTEPAAQSDLESIIAACLSEAQLRLLAVEEDLIGLFGESEPGAQASVAATNAKLGLINSALQVLPMPEVTPLITGVQSFISRHENQSLSRGAHRDLATVMVSLGYYLNSVLQPNGAAGQLLLEAEEALLQLDIEGLETNDDTLNVDAFDVTRALGAQPSDGLSARSGAGFDDEFDDDEYDATIVDQASDTQVERFIDISLQQMNTISSAVFEYEQANLENQLDVAAALRSEIISAYQTLGDEAIKFESRELEALSLANVRMLESGSDSANTQTLLDESVAVLPQLINQLHSTSDRVYGLQALLDRLTDAAGEDLTLAMDVQNILAQNTLSEDLTFLDGTLTDETVSLQATTAMEKTIAFESTHLLDSSMQVPREELLDATIDDDSPVMTLDNTLEQVFFRECDQHMLILRKSVADALASNNWENDAQRAALNLSTQKAGVDIPDIAPAQALPNRDMLRALHTLTGSAQTVDAQNIIAIAQPLQKAALLKQRNGEMFDRSETEYIGELLDVLQARLEAMETDTPLSEDNDALMARLNEFVARSEPWVPERKAGLQLSNDASSIENVFQEEARELLEALRLDAERLGDDAERTDAIDRILSCLHTIKGSARMAGQSALADRAHELEDEMRLADGAVLDSVVQLGLGELQTLMLVEVTEPSEPTVPAPARAEPMGLTEATFENMLSLATRATVSQAKLGESMLRLRDACRDIETTSLRLQRLPHDHTDLNSPAVAEMLKDLESAQRMLADALLDAEAEHTQGSRADASLHQTLIRAQMVSFSESQIRLQHTLNDAAKETNKAVDFVLTGCELNLDKSTFRKLMTPLEHLIRNAVVHGIEAEAERSASGKSARGVVAVDAKIDGTDLLIEVSDDGAGIKRLPGVSSDKLLEQLCEPGYTTHTDADQLGGRGLGLSTVKALVEELDGSLHLGQPETGGSVFSLRVPQKIRINQVVLVEHRSRLYAIPVNFIHTVVDEQHDLSQADIQFNNVDYGCCALDAIINGDIAYEAAANAGRVVLIGVQGKHIALLVDKVIGYREVIAQPLGAQLSGLKRYLGGSVLADGRVVLIPDFNRLLSPEKVLPQSNWGAANTAILSRTALIVDDSITMRIAAEQMLQNLNIEPNMARDGAEAIELVADALPDLLLVDIDMPRMNGFDFLRHLRVLYPEHDTPVIMISTRDTDEDRKQAKELGALEYVVKPYSQQQMQMALEKVGIL